ncbi:Sideroflexin-1 [Eumeta japonica]|uniref:Sideroflexin-1 n=1 Tax=Eumeta variegata TaxID=151549 RepID=A0A4C1VN84_EUMVA|nr:Sideroflexin-1 [Eumeta japonica]
MAPPPIDLMKPPYDLETYSGRAQHFLRLTNPLNILATTEELAEAQKIVNEFKKTRKVPPDYSEEKLWKMKYLYDSAFHPDTGEKMFVLGRMAAQAPCNTVISGAMISFYKSPAAVVFWQWINQSFNAVVNYTNRSGDAPLSTKKYISYVCLLFKFTDRQSISRGSRLAYRECAIVALHAHDLPFSRILCKTGCKPSTLYPWLRLCFIVSASKWIMLTLSNTNSDGHFDLLASYCAACGGAVGTALYLNKLAKRLPPVFARLVPFAAVCAANFINIPMMRSNELLNGTPVFTKEDKRVGDSKVAARQGILLVCLSRVLMAVPGMSAYNDNSDLVSSLYRFRRLS